MIYIINKISKGYVWYLYTQIKYKSITVYFNNKTAGDDQITVSKETLHFKYALKNKQNRLRQMKKITVKEESY